MSIKSLSTPGERIRDLRHRLGMSARDLAEKANVTEAYISMIEKGKKAPQSDALYLICTALGTTADYVLFGKAAEPLERKKIVNYIDNVTDIDEMKTLYSYIDSRMKIMEYAATDVS